MQFSLSQTEQGNMHSSSEIKRVYSPQDLDVMTAAYDKVYACFPSELGENDRARRKLALLILRAVDHGVRDPDTLADLVLLDFLRQI